MDDVEAQMLREAAEEDREERATAAIERIADTLERLLFAAEDIQNHVRRYVP